MSGEAYSCGICGRRLLFAGQSGTVVRCDHSDLILQLRAGLLRVDERLEAIAKRLEAVEESPPPRKDAPVPPLGAVTHFHTCPASDPGPADITEAEACLACRAARAEAATALAERDGAVSIGTQLDRELQKALAETAKLQHTGAAAQLALDAQAEIPAPKSKEEMIREYIEQRRQESLANRGNSGSGEVALRHILTILDGAKP